MKYFVGAYAASPSVNRWDFEAESEFYRGLREREAFQRMQGLEHPFYGRLHRDDSQWFLENIRPDWDFVLTCIPGTMDRLAKSPHFGLASADAGGRQAALDFAKAARDSALELNAYLKRKAVVSVLLHSAPSLGVNGVRSSKEMLARSLSLIRSWDWQGARVCIEHCDAFVPGQVAAKGFLSLGDELWAIRETEALGTHSGVTINWGRSAIELRDPGGPLIHLHGVQEAGFLSGLMFSGVCPNDALYGNWADSHAPFQNVYGPSLLGEEAVVAAIQAGGFQNEDLDRVLGFKIQSLPRSLSTVVRLQGLERSIQFLDQYFQRACGQQRS